MVVMWKKYSLGLALLGLQQVLIVLTAADSAQEPSFLGPINNVTVVQGSNASLTCKVDNLGDYKIVWIGVNDILLTIQDNVLYRTALYQIWAERLSVTKSDRVTWTLHIRNVRRMHQGFYRCLVIDTEFTEPTIMQTPYLEVLIPPDVILNETTNLSAQEPIFLGSINNVTVVEGRNASFTCRVDNLVDYKIAWINVEDKRLLAVQEIVITQNKKWAERLSVTKTDRATWTLHIRNVRRMHQGFYMCQVSTEPMIMQKAYLEVLFPPDIISNETTRKRIIMFMLHDGCSSLNERACSVIINKKCSGYTKVDGYTSCSCTGDLVVPEGRSAKLICKATGHPKPNIVWRKEDDSRITIQGPHGKELKEKTVKGEVLTLSNIAHSEMGAYLCIASNGIPPSVSKRILIMVRFRPQIRVVNQMIGAQRGVDVTLECLSEAYPKAITYWTRDTGELIFNNKKFVEEAEILSHYSIRMRLRIRTIERRDYTGYKCMSQNSMGNAEGTIHIHEISKTNLEDQSIEESAVPAGDTPPPSTDAPILVSSSPDNNSGREAPGMKFCLSSWVIKAFVPWCVSLSSLLA